MRALIAASLLVTAMPMVAASGQDGIIVKAPRQICRRVTTTSESRIARTKVCLTATEWRARSEGSSDDYEDKLNLLSRGNSQGQNAFKARGPR